MKKTPKSGALHPRNPHAGRYDFAALTKACPELNTYIKPNPKGDNTIDFANEKAVLCFNRALLAYYYRVHHWQIPTGYLCSPIPGRADYIHYAADLLAKINQEGVTENLNEPPKGKQIKVLDIGTGANCIYPIIGSQSYGWQFVGSDIDKVALETAKVIVTSNPNLSKLVKLVFQSDKQSILKGVIKASDKFDLTLCNPPFHASLKDALAANQRKRDNLRKNQAISKSKDSSNSKLNFGGQNSELWCPGGELEFIKKMMKESVGYANNVCWFTSLVSNGDHINPLKKALKQLGAKQVETINMSQGQKISRLVAWSFLSSEEQLAWARLRWPGANQ